MKIKVKQQKVIKKTCNTLLSHTSQTFFLVQLCGCWCCKALQLKIMVRVCA